MAVNNFSDGLEAARAGDVRADQHPQTLHARLRRACGRVAQWSIGGREAAATRRSGGNLRLASLPRRVCGRRSERRR